MEGCCDSGVGRFNVPPTEPEIWATYNVQSSRFIVVGTVYTGGKASSTAASTTSSASQTSSTSESQPSDSATTISSTSSTVDPKSQGTGASDAATQQSSGTGLSGGAIGGIVAGICVSVILLLAAAFLFWRSRKKSHAAEPNTQPQPPMEQPKQYYTGVPGPAEMDPTPKHYAVPPQELHGHANTRTELPAH
jgi:hypothetical protein